MDLTIFGHAQAAMGAQVLASFNPSNAPDERVLKSGAKVLWSLGLTDQALTAMRLLEQFDALDADDLYKRGCWQLYRGDTKAALSDIERGLKLAPDENALLLAYAYALFYLRDYDGAATVFERLTDDPNLTSPTPMAEASRRMRDGLKPDQVIGAPLPGLPAGMSDAMQTQLIYGLPAALNLISRIEPTLDEFSRFAIWHLEALYLLEVNQVPLALERVEQILAKVPENGFAHYLKGIACQRLNRTDVAFSAFENAVLLCPLQARAWSALGASMLQRMDYHRALDRYRMSVHLDPKNALAWSDMASGYYMIDSFSKAVEAYNHAIDLGGHTFENYLNRGLTRQQLSDASGMASDFIKAISLDPSRPKSEELRSLLRDQLDERYKFGQELIQR